MEKKTNTTRISETEKLDLTENLIFDIILWTLFLPIKLVFTTMRADKHKIPLIFLTVFVSYAYMLSFLQVCNYFGDAVKFKHDVISTMIFDRVEMLDPEEISPPTQNIPDIFSYTLVDSTVAIYHPDALSPEWGNEYEEVEDLLSELKYDSPVYVTKNGTKFHLEGCRHLNENARKIIYQNALTNGYTPCKVCFKT